MVEPLARAAMAVGIDGLFFETHPDPDRSPSDGPNMIPLSDVRGMLIRLLKIRHVVESMSGSRGTAQHENRLGVEGASRSGFAECADWPPSCWSVAEIRCRLPGR